METLQFEKLGPIGVLKINRPQALNALNAQVIGELESFLLSFQKEPSCRVLVVTGAGEKAFVAGADIKEMKDHSADQAYEMSLKGQRVFSLLESLPVPTIACVNGFALGGGLELALSCDILVASEKAKLGLPEVTLGLIPGYGGTQRLTRVVGPVLAKRMIYSGEAFSAQRLQSWGLISDVWPAEELLAETMKLAETIATRAPQALAQAKKAIYEGMQTSQDKGLQLEAQGFKEVFTTQDHLEGIQAFIEKRSPDFKGE